MRNHFLFFYHLQREFEDDHKWRRTIETGSQTNAAFVATRSEAFFYRQKVEIITDRFSFGFT